MGRIEQRSSANSGENGPSEIPMQERYSLAHDLMDNLVGTMQQHNFKGIPEGYFEPTFVSPKKFGMKRHEDELGSPNGNDPIPFIFGDSIWHVRYKHAVEGEKQSVTTRIKGGEIDRQARTVRTMLLEMSGSDGPPVSIQIEARHNPGIDLSKGGWPQESRIVFERNTADPLNLENTPEAVEEIFAFNAHFLSRS